MNNERLFYLVGFVKVSNYRTMTMKSLGTTLKMPSEIAHETNLRTSQVSRVLGDLKRENLVICVNEDARKGRLYQCTPLGLEILEQL